MRPEFRERGNNVRFSHLLFYQNIIEHRFFNESFEVWKQFRSLISEIAYSVHLFNSIFPNRCNRQPSLSQELK